MRWFSLPVAGSGALFTATQGYVAPSHPTGRRTPEAGLIGADQASVSVPPVRLCL